MFELVSVHLCSEPALQDKLAHTKFYFDSIVLSKVSINLETILSLVGYCAYKTYQTNGKWLQTKIDFIAGKFNIKIE